MAVSNTVKERVTRTEVKIKNVKENLTLVTGRLDNHIKEDNNRFEKLSEKVTNLRVWQGKVIGASTVLIIIVQVILKFI